MSVTLHEGNVMAVRLKVREIAEQKGFNISTLSRKSDVGLSTVRRLWHDPLQACGLLCIGTDSKSS